MGCELYQVVCSMYGPADKIVHCLNNSLLFIEQLSSDLMEYHTVNFMKYLMVDQRADCHTAPGIVRHKCGKSLISAWSDTGEPFTT